MNVLLTCAGRRSYLVRFFREALRGRGEVIACDCCANAPTLADADRSFVVPRVDAPEYADTLLAVCRENAVRLVIGVNDLELADLARQAPRFRAAGTVVVVASPRVISTCQDKWATYGLLRSLEIPTPKTYPSIDEARRALARGEIRFPLVIKPRRGTSSIGVECVENRRELGLAWEWVRIQVRRSILAGVNGTHPDDGFIIQEWLAGREFGIDVVNDL
jgi:carbamoyl-phosphate synthase large subunit